MPDVDDVERCQDGEGVVRSRREPCLRSARIRRATNPTHYCGCFFAPVSLSPVFPSRGGNFSRLVSSQHATSI